MQILFTVAGDDERDVWVEADPSAPFAVLGEALGSQEGTSVRRSWWDGDRLLEPDVPVGAQVLEGAILSPRPTDPSKAPMAGVAGELLAVSGPHAGSTWALTRGRHLIGRSDNATVNLVRDRMVSRRHATLEVGADGLTVQDEGSAHGLTIEGQQIDAGPVPDGAFVRVGHTVLMWRSRQRPTATVVPDGEGGLVFNRPPRMLSPAANLSVRLPGPPPARRGMNFPLMASLAPLALGVVLAFALQNLTYLLFTALAPVVAASNYLSTRRSGIKSHRELMRAHQSAEAKAKATLEAAVKEETTQRRQAFPDPATLAAVAEGPQESLWERRRDDADFMTLSIGLGSLPSSVTIEDRDEPPPFLDEVPAVVNLQRDGVLGIAGGRRACEAVATSLVLQAAVLHAPDDLTITVLTGAHQHERWSWARWLPHVRDKDGRCVARIGNSDTSVARLAGEISTLIDERTEPRGLGATGRTDLPPAHLVIVDGAYQLGALPAVTKILRRGPAAGVMSVCLEDAERLLPEECQAVAVLDLERPAWLRLRTGRGSESNDLIADMVEPPTAERVARRLAPLRLNRRKVAGAALPTSLRLVAQLGLEPPTPAAVLSGWRARDRSTAAVIGECEMGPMVVDLAKDGPHGLVAGTTGSGKSEVLQTLIASLALANRPDLMNFVLVDYKGGSAFKDCADLPHTVGMVTDLDSHLTERALASIGAELRRREVILSEAGAKDIEGYWRAAPAGHPPLGRLVIVIDEFASLVEELPSFVDGLVDLARRGRSLGIHLILATQRPSGVVSASIKTNTNLRIAMRVTDAADSVDAIDSPLASRIPKSVPGRGYARVGHEDLTEFQAARIGGRRPQVEGPALRTERVRWEDLGESLWRGDGPQVVEETTDLAVLVEAICEAADAEQIPSPRSPWLPALPDQLTVAEADLSRTRRASLTAVLGVEDLPDRQAQGPATYDVARDGHLLVVGDPGSGRSTLLRSLAASLAMRTSTSDVHIYGIDCGNGALTALEPFPHVGAVVTRREPERVDRLITKITAQTTERQQKLARGGFTTIADQRAMALPEERMPYIVILLDRWEGFSAEFDAADGGRLVTAMTNLMREGHGAGIRVVVTADRSGTSPRFASLADRIIMLRLNDRTVYSIVGLNPRYLPDMIGPGRGFYARGGTEVQVGLLDDNPAGPAQVAAIDRLARAAAELDWAVPEECRPDPVAILPFHVSLAPLLVTIGPGASKSAPMALVGIGGDRLNPQYLDLCSAGPGFLVMGPPRSGRSNALMTIAHSVLAGGGRVLAVTSRPSPLIKLVGMPGVVAVVDGLTVTGADLASSIAAVPGGGLAVLVDDAELIADASAGEGLAAFMRAARDRGSALVIAGTTGELNQFRGFIPEVRKSKLGLVLCPSAGSDGEPLGVRLPRTALFSGPPGRGMLVRGSELDLVQVPFDDLQ